jgi:hypothetical protein
MRMRSGFTLVELLALLVITMFLLALLVLGLDQLRYRSRMERDSMQVRAIHQGLVMGFSAADEYPMPSRIDRLNTTVVDEGPAKDTTANIMSFLVACGLVSPEELVSPLEVNRAIRPYREYEYQNPSRAVSPAHAHWDPGFSADFRAPGGGHTSYAHLPPFGPRRAKWGNTFIASEAVVGLRGPRILGAEYGPGQSVSPVLESPTSLTFRIHRPRRNWGGHVVFNDNHVEYLSELVAGTYVDAQGRQRPDLLHYNEPDDPAGDNHLLGIYIRAGARLENLEPIWD